MAAAWFPRLALACVEQDRGGAALVNTAVVVDDGRPGWTMRGVTRLVCASRDLREQGVSPPMRILDAQRYAPALDAVAVRQARLERELREMAELCLGVSPLVEPAGDVLFLDLTGIPRPVPTQLLAIEVTLEQAGHEVAVAASPGKHLSAALARAAWRYRQTPRPPRLYAPAEQVGEVLDRLPLDVLDLSPELGQALAELGMVSVRDLARLRSLKGLSARLAYEAQRVLDLIAHHDQAPVVGIDPPDEIAEELELDWSLASVEPLLFVLRPRLERLLGRLHARRERLVALKVVLSLLPFSHSENADDELDGPEDRALSLVFPEPVDDPRALLKALELRLERTGLAGEVHRVRLIVERSAAVTAHQPQLTLDGASHADESPRALSGLLAELVCDLGPERVGCLEPRPGLLPERMTRLSWPGQSAAPARRGRGAGGTLPDEVGREGLFWDLWPWPVRLLREPLDAGRLSIKATERFCRLEGEDEADRPYVRDYWILTLDDGRRALGVIDPEEERLYVQGWFD